MENPNKEISHQVAPPPQGHKGRSFLLLLFLLLCGAGVVGGVYYTQHAKAQDVSSQIKSLDQQIVVLKSQIKTQEDINKGVPKTGNEHKDPAGKLAMQEGVITFTMPKDWARVATNSCYGGFRGGVALCSDVARIAPISLIDKEGNASWSVDVGVYENTNAKTDARIWFEEDFIGSKLVNMGEPAAADTKSYTVQGYNAFKFLSVNGATNKPDIATSFHTVVHGKYAIAVMSEVVRGSSYATATSPAYDYRKQYVPVIDELVDSLRIQE